MNCGEIMSRVYAGLDDNTIFFEPDEIVDCINEASTLVVLLKPGLCQKRVAINAIEDEMNFDLRGYAPNLLRCDGVAVGDVTTDTPVPSHGILRHLRRATRTGLRSRKEWLHERTTAPWVYVHRWGNEGFGCQWLVTAPRAVHAHTLTLAYRAEPVRLALDALNVSPDIPEPFHPTIAEVAKILAQAKEGAGTMNECAEALARIFGREPLQALTQAVSRAERRTAYMSTQGAA